MSAFEEWWDKSAKDGPAGCDGYEWAQAAWLAALAHADVPALVQALNDLLDRIDRNGGIGEYKGGPAFAVKRARELVEKHKAALDAAMGSNNG